MSILSSADQQVWKKVLAAKNKSMTLSQIEASMPGMPKREVTSSIGNLIKHKLLSTERKDTTTIFHAIDPADAKKTQTLTQEQMMVLSAIGHYGRNGVSAKGLRVALGGDVITMPTLRKTLDILEKSGHIKTYKSINATTTPMYILKHLKPPQSSTGGIWFDQNMEYDEELVSVVSQVLLRRVQDLTWPNPAKRDKHQNSLCPNPIFPAARTPKLPTPTHLLRHINNSKAISVKVRLQNIMECMRMLELDGLVEAVKPIGGVEPQIEEESAEDSDEEETGGKRRKVENEDEDEEVKERRREKEKERLKEKKRKEREKAKKKEREKQKEKEKRRKRKEKEREEKREKEREKKRRKKAKDRKKQRMASSSENDSDADSEDALVTLEEAEKSKKSKSTSKKSKSKRKRLSISSVSASSSASSSGSGSDSASDSDSDDSDADSVSSVSSGSIDEHVLQLKPTASRAQHDVDPSQTFGLADQSTLNNLQDTRVVYRAVRRLNFGLGVIQVPCGKCPVFGFCEEDGPVNPQGCGYLGDWLADDVGGWDERGMQRFRKDLMDERRGVTRGKGKGRDEWDGERDGDGEFDELGDGQEDELEDGHGDGVPDAEQLRMLAGLVNGLPGEGEDGSMQIDG